MEKEIRAFIEWLKERGWKEYTPPSVENCDYVLYKPLSVDVESSQVSLSIYDFSKNILDHVGIQLTAYAEINEHGVRVLLSNLTIDEIQKPASLDKMLSSLIKALQAMKGTE